MVVVQVVELSVLAVAVVIKKCKPNRRAIFFFLFPLKTPLESLIHHTARLIFYFNVVSEITAPGGSTNKTEGIGIKFRSPMDKEWLFNGIDMPPITPPGVKPEIFRGL